MRGEGAFWGGGGIFLVVTGGGPGGDPGALDAGNQENEYFTECSCYYCFESLWTEERGY